MNKNKEDKIIEYFKQTQFFKGLNADEVKTVSNIITKYKDQKREVLILKIAELIINWQRFQPFY